MSQSNITQLLEIYIMSNKYLSFGDVTQNPPKK